MKKQKPRNALIPVLVVIVLMLLSACRTIPPEPIPPEPIPPQTISLDWPSIESAQGHAELSDDEESVIVDFDYWMATRKYIVGVRAVRKILEATIGGPIEIVED